MDKLTERVRQCDKLIRRPNIIIEGVPEKQGDTPKKIVNLLSDIGAITGTERVSLDAAYRIGKPKQNQTSPRNIMVRFKDMEHKMRLFQEKKDASH